MKLKYILYGLLFTNLLYSCEKEDNREIEILDHTRSEVTHTLIANSSLIHRVYTDTTITLHPGVESTDIHFMDIKGHSIRVFILKADMNKANLKLQPLTPFGSEAFAMQTIPDMLKYVSKDAKILFGVNSDFFNTSTGEPRSILYLEGKPIRTIIPAERSYFGVNKAGQLIIGDGLSYEANKSEIYNAVGGHHTLVRDGLRVGQTDVTVEPRTAVGFTTGNIVYFVVVDGRRYDYSYGINLTDLSEIMLALGSHQSINLDGGGSSTYVINNPLGEVFQVRNWSSDRSPRAVANGWALVSKTP
jgi:hypothetical protein